MNKYRTHNCGELKLEHINKNIKLAGWVNKKRDHGNLLFIDLRDNYGITQCVIDNKSQIFNQVEKIPLETVISVSGDVIKRSEETINESLNTGNIEIKIKDFTILGESKELPLPVFLDEDYSEEIRLKYRFLDLRRKRIHQNIILRSKIISFIRKEMEKKVFWNIKHLF